MLFFEKRKGVSDYILMVTRIIMGGLCGYCTEVWNVLAKPYKSDTFSTSDRGEDWLLGRKNRYRSD